MKAEDIKKLRVKLNVTQEGLALALDISPQTVARWEQKIRQPSRLAKSALRRLAATVKE